MDSQKEILKKKEHYHVGDLEEIVKVLRAPDGCPWDREQDHHSIRRSLIEETYEVIEGIDKDDPEILCEELGDLLLQIIFHTEIEEEKGGFTLGDVCDGICRKLIYRHPHVFGDVVAETSAEVLTNWDQLKKEEKHQKTDHEVLDAVSHSLPALIRADKLSSKGRKLGYPTPDENIVSLAQSFTEKPDEKTLGSLLFEICTLAHKSDLDPEKALADACDSFIALADKSEN